jgi:hypothetical protein
LLLAARKGMCGAFCSTFQPHPRQKRHGPFPCRLRNRSAKPPKGVGARLEPKKNIFQDTQVRKKSEVLKHETNAALFGRKRKFSTGNNTSLERNFTFMNGLETTNKTQQRAFPAPRRAQKSHDFALCNMKRNARKGAHVTVGV